LDPFFLSEGAAGLGVGATISGLVASASAGAGATSSVAGGSSAGVESASGSVAAFFRGWTLMPFVFFRYLRCEADEGVGRGRSSTGQRGPAATAIDGTPSSDAP
jgi:hypothetical protein